MTPAVPPATASSSCIASLARWRFAPLARLQEWGGVGDVSLLQKRGGLRRFWGKGGGRRGGGGILG